MAKGDVLRRGRAAVIHPPLRAPKRADTIQSTVAINGTYARTSCGGTRLAAWPPRCSANMELVHFHQVGLTGRITRRVARRPYGRRLHWHAGASHCVAAAREPTFSRQLSSRRMRADNHRPYIDLLAPAGVSLTDTKHTKSLAKDIAAMHDFGRTRIRASVCNRRDFRDAMHRQGVGSLHARNAALHLGGAIFTVIFLCNQSQRCSTKGVAIRLRMRYFFGADCCRNDGTGRFITNLRIAGAVRHAQVCTPVPHQTTRLGRWGSPNRMFMDGWQVGRARRARNAQGHTRDRDRGTTHPVATIGLSGRAARPRAAAVLRP